MKEIKTYEEFKEVIASEKPVIVKFGAPWCGPCKQIENIISDVEKQGFENEIYKLNIEAVPQPAEDYAVMGIPVTIAFAKGEKIKKHIGLASEEQIKNLIYK